LEKLNDCEEKLKKLNFEVDLLEEKESENEKHIEILERENKKLSAKNSRS